MKTGRPTIEMALQGIGDVLVYAVAHKTQRDTVDSCFETLSKAIDGLLAMRDVSEHRFVEKVLNPSYAEHTEEDLGLALWLSPEHVLSGFTLPVEQVQRAFEAASNAGNNYAADKATAWFNDLLQKLVSRPDNQQLVRAVLQKYDDMLLAATKSGENYQKSRTAHGWYFDAVFGMQRFQKKHFRMEYLDILSNSVFARMRWMIDKDESAVFKGYVSSTVDSVFQHPDGEDAHGLWSYIFSLGRKRFDHIEDLAHVEETTAYLRRLEEGCVIPTTVATAGTRLRQFYEDASPLLNEEEALRVKEICRGILMRLEHFARLSRLDELTFSLAAYCLATDRQELVRELLEYNRPPGATCISCNRDPLPTKANDILKEYLLCWSDDRRFDNFGSHLNGESFKRRLAVDLLARVLGPAATTGNLNPFTLHPEKAHFDSVQVSSARYEAGRMVELANAMMQGDTDILLVGNGDPEAARGGLGNVSESLKALQAQMEDAMEAAVVHRHISPDIVSEFQQNVLKTFNDSSGWRGLLDSYPSLYFEDDFSNYGTGDMWGITILDDKASFFDEWHVHYMGRGESYGRGLAQDEEKIVTAAIRGQCGLSDAGSLDVFLDSLPEGRRFVAIASALAPLRMEGTEDIFVPSWRLPEDLKGDHINGFLQVHGEQVPVYRLGGWDAKDELALIDIDRLGRWVQKSPLSKDDDPSWMVGFLKIAVVEAESDSRLMQQNLESQPDWLANRESTLSPEDYLKTRAWVRVFERFSLELSDDFEGWLFKFPSKD